MEYIKKISNIIFNILLVIIFIIVLLVGYNYISISFSEKSYANFFGFSFFEVSTGSMKDALDVYDIVRVEITKDVKEGDIITYEKDGNLITHRIVKMDGDKIIARGDANNTNDKEITKENVVGKVVSVYPKVGIWIKVFSEPKILISVFITFLLIGKAIISLSPRRKEENKVG